MKNDFHSHRFSKGTFSHSPFFGAVLSDLEFFHSDLTSHLPTSILLNSPIFPSLFSFGLISSCPQVKPAVLSNGHAEFLSKCEGLANLEISKKVVQELKWGPPVYDARSHGWNYGLYSKFANKEDYDLYKVDEGHAE